MPSKIFMEWDTDLIVNEKRFVTRYSLIYTLIVSFILLMPLYIYIDHKIKLKEIKTEMQMQALQSKIIEEMREFGNHPEKIFHFPKYPNSRSGLYKADFEPVFTQIKETLPAYMPGYHARGDERFLISSLPAKKYFFADYLVTQKRISFASIYFEAALIALGIMLLILLLSFYFLHSFSRPFQYVNEKLDSFIKEAMHEINTPLSIISVNIDLFENIHGVDKYLHRIKSAARSLSTIYNDMDYLIKQNRIEYKNERIDLNAFIKERIHYFELVCELKNIHLEFSAAASVHIDFNPTKLQRIVDNTLSNAIKFSNRDSKIEIKLALEKEDVVLSIRDFGSGMKNPHKITTRYYRENEGKKGFGIGMSIVKSIVDAAEISMRIDSTPGEGSTFYYIFHPPLILDVQPTYRA